MNDAQGVAAALVDLGYPPGNVTQLANATQHQFLVHFEWFLQRVAPMEHCTVVLYFSGHAIVDEHGANVLLSVDSNVEGKR